MSDVESKVKLDETRGDGGSAVSSEQFPRKAKRLYIGGIPVLVTLATVAVAALFGYAMWDAYIGSPWTRDGTVRAHVVTIAPDVAGRIVKLPVTDNQFVHKGDLLMVIDPTNYKIALTLAAAAARQVEVNAQNAGKEAGRRRELASLSAIGVEQEETYEATALADQAGYQQAEANLAQARANLERTQIRSPANGYVTNLLAQLGDYANIGQNEISIVDADSIWVDGYFEETMLGSIHEGDTATIKLMGYRQAVRGHVDSIAHGITVPNAQPDQIGLATVNPIFTWVRLAQRIPVHIHIDQVPRDVVMIAGMTATVEVDRRPEYLPTHGLAKPSKQNGD